MNFNQQLLIALPDMQDPRFKQAVILICEHNENGAMGLLLNHSMDIDTDDVFADLQLEIPAKNQIVLEGGPLNQNTGFILHNSLNKFKSSMKIQNNLNLTTSKDILDSIATNKFKDDWLFILGYSGWSKNQLEDEIAQNAWLTAPIDHELIFHTEIDKKWAKALASIGIHDVNSISGVGHA